MKYKNLSFHICILCKNYCQDVIMYACEAASIIETLSAISLFPATVLFVEVKKTKIPHGCSNKSFKFNNRVG